MSVIKHKMKRKIAIRIFVTWFVLFSIIYYQAVTLHKQDQEIKTLYVIKNDLEKQIDKHECNVGQLNAPPQAQNELYNVPLSEEVQRYTFDICKAKNVSTDLVFAVMDKESGFDPNVIKNGNYGLMQINKSNHKWLSEQLGITDFLDPKQNILAGVCMLSAIQSNNHGSIHKDLMVYNMGSRGAKRDWANGTVTSPYSEKVVEKMEEYENAD